MHNTVSNVNVKDQDHIWFQGRQYISLRRFYERLGEITDECRQLVERNNKLQEENNTLSKLLANRIVEQDTPNTTNE